MPHIVFTEEEEAAIQRVMDRFDPERSPLYQGVREHLSPEDWAFVLKKDRPRLEGDLRDLICTAMVGEPTDLFDPDPDEPDGDWDREMAIAGSLPQEIALEISGPDMPESIWIIARARNREAAEQALREELAGVVSA